MQLTGAGAIGARGLAAAKTASPTQEMSRGRKWSPWPGGRDRGLYITQGSHKVGATINNLNVPNYIM